MGRITPGMPEAVVRTGREVVVVAGEERQAVEIHFQNPEQIEEFRQGYRCLQCMGVQSRPFPKRCEQRWLDVGHPADCLCPTCGCHYEIAKRQPADFEREFRGVEELWPDRTPDRERESWRPSTGRIWLPGDAT